MKIYDCVCYFDEDLILDIRLNILNEYVDKFIILESKEINLLAGTTVPFKSFAICSAFLTKESSMYDGWVLLFGNRVTLVWPKLLDLNNFFVNF